MAENDKFIIISTGQGIQDTKVNEPTMTSGGQIDRHALDSNFQRLPVVSNSLGKRAFFS